MSTSRQFWSFSSSDIPTLASSTINFNRTLHLRSHSQTATTSQTSLSSEHHYERKAPRYWDNFYKRHHNKFFKDRHYLEKDWGNYFASPTSLGPKVVLEVGCGAGNTVFPLLDAFPNLFIHACDFSHNAISLVKSREEFRGNQVNAFLCDITKDDLFFPQKMPFVLQMLKKVLKPGGYVLFRDYAVGDFAQEKLIDRNQIISENFCIRGDGTCAFYFSEDYLSCLFRKEGYNAMEINTYCKEIVNHSRDIVMNRRWMRAVFCNQDPYQNFLHEA